MPSPQNTGKDIAQSRLGERHNAHKQAARALATYDATLKIRRALIHQGCAIVFSFPVTKNNFQKILFPVSNSPTVFRLYE